MDFGNTELSINSAKKQNFIVNVTRNKKEFTRFTVANIPAFILPAVDVSYAGSHQKVSGETAMIEEFSLTFLVDENYDVYFELLSWIAENRHGADKENQIKFVMFDSYGKERMAVTFKKVAITSVGGIEFATNDSEDVLVDATFECGDYSFIRYGKSDQVNL